MTSPNAQLQAILVEYSNQAGVSPEQAALLRATISGDSDLTQRFNEQAATGNLTGFSHGQSNQGQLIGTYEKATGVVTLPGLASGPGLDQGLRGALRLQEMSIRFAHSTYTDSDGQNCIVSQDMVSNLQTTINGSPTLANEMKRAVTTVDNSNRQSRDSGGPHMLLEHFAPLSGTIAGGTFNPGSKTMSIPPKTLDQPAAAFHHSKAAADLTFVLGHETQHAFNQVEVAAAYRDFDRSARRIAEDNNPTNDYTAPIEQLVASNRRDEAKAQIAGWNAFVDSVRQREPAADLTTMMNLRISRTGDFIENDPTRPGHAKPREGFNVNSDGTLSMTEENVATQERYYFNKPPLGAQGLPASQTIGIGFHGDSDYPNYYGAGAVSRAIAYDRTYAHPVAGVEPKMQLDMQRLRLDERLLERNGITLPAATAATPQEYWDTSTTPPTRGLFQHTRDSHEHIYPSPEFDPTPDQSQTESAKNIDAALFDKIRNGVRDLDSSVGKSWDEHSDRLSASLLLMATDKGFTAQDDVRIACSTGNDAMNGGQFLHLWRCGHPSPDPAAHRASMTMQDALSLPADQRLAQVQDMQQTKAEDIQASLQRDVAVLDAATARSM